MSGLCISRNHVYIELREGEGEGRVGSDGVVEFLVVVEEHSPEIGASDPCADCKGHSGVVD